jgi:hypothetical protein
MAAARRSEATKWCPTCAAEAPARRLVCAECGFRFWPRFEAHPADMASIALVGLAVAVVIAAGRRRSTR